MKLKRITLLIADRCGRPDVEIKIGDHVELITKGNLSYKGTITAIWDTVIELKIDKYLYFNTFPYEVIDQVIKL